MSEFLALDWDDQHLIGFDARVANDTVHLRKPVRFDWTAKDRPSEQPEAAGKRLRDELNASGIRTTSVLVSLPREAAVVRLLEIPDCSDEELPELVRFQAATRSSVPLDRLLLDYLPLPRLAGVEGRRVLMVTLGKPTADRIQTILSSAGLHVVAIELSAVGAAELVAREPAPAVDSATATLIVACAGSRVEITATWQNYVVMMHAANLSGHDPADVQLTQVLTETVRASVAFAQAAPGLRLGCGWVVGASELPGLASALKKRLGFEFQVLESPFRNSGIHADFDSHAAAHDAAVGPVGVLLGQAERFVQSIDFLHPRRKIVKPDRRRLWRGVAAAAAAILLIGGFFGVRRRMAQLDDRIEKKQIELADRRKELDGAAPFLETAKSISDWTSHDLDWLEQFRLIAKAMKGPDKLYLTGFDATVSPLGSLASIKASGRARSIDDADDMGNELETMGYRVHQGEIATDAVDPQYPEKFEETLDVTTDVVEPKKPPQQAAPAKSAASDTARPAPPQSKSASSKGGA